MDTEKKVYKLSTQMQRFIEIIRVIIFRVSPIDAAKSAVQIRRRSQQIKEIMTGWSNAHFASAQYTKHTTEVN